MPNAKTDVIGVLLVDDHRMFAESLARLLSTEADIEVLAVATDGATALDLADALDPRVILVDHQMPGQDGVSVAGELKRRNPERMVVMLTGSTDDRLLLAAIEAGCSGFLTKDRAASEVAETVRVAAAGEALITPAMLARLLPRIGRTERSLGSDLTEREVEVLRLLAAGYANRAVAGELYLSVNTVRNYVQSILVKLGAHSKLEAVATAVREGIVDYPSS
jgi:DNA-binding NarL/FixJ family response regulator